MADDMWGISMARSIISTVVKGLLGSELISSDASEKLRNLETCILPRLVLLHLQTLENTRRHELEISMRELKSAFYQVEDIIDEAEYRCLEEQVVARSNKESECKFSSVYDAGISNQNVFTDSCYTVPEPLTIRLTELLKKIVKLIDDVEKTVGLADLPRIEVTGRHDARNRGLSNEPTMEDLLWSYHHLDEQLKRCLAYCSIFPRRHRLQRDEIINMWMAEGFIKVSDAGEDMEEVGARYFDELVEASFLQPTEKMRGMLYDVSYFTMHDLAHDLAEKVAGNDILRIEDDGWPGEAPEDVRHAFVQTCFGDPIIEKIGKLENLRTLIIYTDTGDKLTVDNVFETFMKLRKLRVLRVASESFNVFSVPPSICQLKHLRYLAFRFRKLALPSTFSKLYHMQVLDFGPCGNLAFSSVEDMANLINLHHIIFEYPADISFPKIGRMTLLKMLPLYNVRKEQGYEIHQLEQLNKLSGRMQIHGLQNVQSKDEAAKAMLANKEELTDLTLHWDDHSCNPDIQAEVLEGLCPPMCLPKLRIDGYHGLKYPAWMVGEQNGPNELGELELFRCNLERPVPELYNFFAHLSSLVLHQCSWDALPEFMENLTELAEMIIYGCMKLRFLPVLPQSLYYLQIDDCNDDFMMSCRTFGHPNWQKINHIPELFVGREPINSPRGSNNSQDSDEDEERKDVLYPLEDDHASVVQRIRETERQQQPPSSDVNRWTLDTMARYHHTSDRRLLDELVSSNEGNRLQIIGSVKTEGFKVPSVRYVQEATRNVISVAQLADHGLVTVFEPTCCYVKVEETGDIIGRGRPRKGLYVLDYLRIHQTGRINPTDVHVDMQDEGEGEGEVAGGQGGGDDGGGVNNNERGRDEEQGGRGGSGGCGDDIGGGCGGDIGGGGQKKEKGEDDDRKGEKNGDQEKAFVTSANECRHPYEFLLDSGACFHMTWNGNILFPYPRTLKNYTQSPISSINGVAGPRMSINVERTGYLNSNNIQLDGVLLAPGSQVNLVSIGQLGMLYGVSTEFGVNNVEIKTPCGEEIGRGKRKRGSHHFVLERFQPGALYAHNSSPYVKFYGRLFQRQLMH